MKIILLMGMFLSFAFPDYGQVKTDSAKIVYAVTYMANYELNQKTKLVLKKKSVDTLIVKDNYAFLTAHMLQTDNREIDLARGIYHNEEAEKSGFFIPAIYVVLLKKDNNIWHIIARAFGCTDVCWTDWPKAYKVPADVFPR
jgi:hypothetical protein